MGTLNTLSYPKCSSEPPTKKFSLYLVGLLCHSVTPIALCNKYIQ